MSEGGRARETGLALAARALVSIYWVALAVFGCARLWREGWGATLAVIHAWYLAALVFLLVWGPATVIVSLSRRRSEPPAARPRSRSASYRLRG